MLHELPEKTKSILDSVLSKTDNHALKHEIEMLVTQAFLAGINAACDKFIEGEQTGITRGVL